MPTPESRRVVSAALVQPFVVIRPEGLAFHFNDGDVQAAEWLTDAKSKAQAEALIAFAELGKLMPKGWPSV